MIMEAGIARQAAAKAQAEGNAEEAKKQMEECDRLTKGAYANFIMICSILLQRQLLSS